MCCKSKVVKGWSMEGSAVRCLWLEMECSKQGVNKTLADDADGCGE